MPSWIPHLDRRDFAQERALAEIEGRDPKEAVRAFLRQEHRFYDLISSEVLPWTRGCEVPLPLPPPNRTPESVEKRRAYTREWWRKNGHEYRRRRRVRDSSPAG